MYPNSNYHSMAHLQFDPVTSRPVSRAASPQPQSNAGLVPAAGRATVGGYPTTTSYRQPSGATDLGHTTRVPSVAAQPQPPTMAGVPPRPATAEQSSVHEVFARYNNGPAAVAVAPTGFTHQFGTTATHQPQQQAQPQAPSSFAPALPPRATHQPPRNSMEMVHDALDQWKSKLEHEQNQAKVLEEEERHLELEEQGLRRRLLDIQAQNRSVDQMMYTTQRGWSTLYEKEHEMRLKEADPAANEERILMEKIAAADLQVQAARAQFHSAEQHSAVVRNDLQSLAHVEAKQREQEEQLTQLLVDFERTEARRQVAKAKCDRYFEIESRRERAARDHVNTINREALEDGECTASSSFCVPAATNPSVLPAAPATTSMPLAAPEDMDDAEGANQMENLFGPGGIAMDSVVLSVCNNTKKRRLESEGSVLSRQPSAAIPAC